MQLVTNKLEQKDENIEHTVLQINTRIATLLQSLELQGPVCAPCIYTLMISN